jgi:hypothetical protein
VEISEKTLTFQKQTKAVRKESTHTLATRCIKESFTNIEKCKNEFVHEEVKSANRRRTERAGQRVAEKEDRKTEDETKFFQLEMIALRNCDGMVK